MRGIQKKKWSYLNLGQIAYAPCLYVGHNLVWTSCLLVHKAIMNGSILKILLEKVKIKQWKMPHVEGFTKIPFLQKFSVYPNVTLQCIQPRSMKNVPIITPFLSQVYIYLIWTILLLLAIYSSALIVKLSFNKSK